MSMIESNLDRYIEQFKQLLQKIIDSKEIDEFDDGECMLSIYQFESDPSKIAEILSKKPELKEFYSKPKPIQVVERSEDGQEIFSEDMSMRILSEYLQEHPEFVYMAPQKSAFSNYATTRFDNIAKPIRERLNLKMQIPFLDDNKDNSKKVAIGYVSYNNVKDEFVRTMQNGEKYGMDIYDAMPLVFNYVYQRTNLEHFKETNNQEAIKAIPEGYRKDIEYTHPVKDNGRE